MSYLCRECANEVHINDNNTAYCTTCNKELTVKETISSWNLEARINQLSAMHTLMCNANDEYIYGTWIYVMPDGATEEDFKDIALDDDMYNECFDLFVKLIKKEGNRW
jgi:DNA-directed RNA polymerase subunit RPC12/RpoP